MKKFVVFGVFLCLFLPGWLIASVNSTVYIAFESIDNSILIWDFVSDTLEIIEAPVTDKIKRIKVSPDGLTLYFSTLDETSTKCELVAYDLKNRAIKRRIQLDLFGMNHVSNIETDITGRYLWLTGRQTKRIDGKWYWLESYVIVIDKESFSVEHIISSNVAVFSSIAFSNDNKKAYFGLFGYLDDSGKLNTVEVYSTETYAKMKSIVVGTEGSAVGGISRGRDGYLIVDNRISGELAKIDTKTDEVVLIKLGHPGENSWWDGGSSLSRGHLFVTLDGPIIGVYDLDSLEPIMDILLPYDTISVPSLIVDQVGRFIIYGTSFWKWDENLQIWIKGKEIRVIDAKTHETFRVLELTGEPVHNVIWLDIADRR